jgi:hypothetical protein
MKIALNDCSPPIEPSITDETRRFHSDFERDYPGMRENRNPSA